MDIIEINQILESYLFSINEMTFKYGNTEKHFSDIKSAIEYIQQNKKVDCIVDDVYVRVQKVADEQDIKYGFVDNIKKDILCEIKYPLKIIWGEPNIITKGTPLEGHGLVHIIQGHKKDFNNIVSSLSNILSRNLAIYNKAQW